MKFSAAKIICVFGLSVLLAGACSRIETANQNDNSAVSKNSAANEKNNAQLIKDDVEELGKIINLPFSPQEATWREDDDAASPQQNGENKTSAPKNLTAVLKFAPEDAGRIAAQAEKYKPAAPAEIDPETWFPAELIAQSQLSGDETLKGALFSADDFFRAPYNKGNLTRINDTNYFVLELNAQ